MMDFLGIRPFLVLSSIVACFLVPSTLSQPMDVFASCLSQYNINNFTVNNHDDPSVYFNFLYFSIQNLRFSTDSSFPKPIAIVMPQNVKQLTNSVRCCRRVSWEIRVRSGGHSYEGTSSVATDGSQFVIIDMINLDRVTVDLESEVAWVEGGATLGQTYYAIAQSSQEHGFPAGSCPTVGVGGHISGGGFGLLSRKYGLTADNVLDAILIDGDGRLLDREAMGEEVFWAIRGGGGGIWGIVYAWKIQLSKVPKVVTGLSVSRSGTKDQIAKLVHKWQLIAPKLDDEFFLSVSVGAVPEAKAARISSTFNGLYLGAKTEALSILREVFPELEATQEECQETSWIGSILYFSGIENGSISQLTDRYIQRKVFFKAKSDYVKVPMTYAAIRSVIDMLEKEPKGYVILDPYGGAMQRISSDSIAFPHRKGNLFTIQYQVEWEKEDNAKSDKYIAWIRGFYKSMTPYVSKAPRAAYVNYIDLELGLMDGSQSANAVEMARAWGERYFLRNYDRLVGAKTLIDPLNIFRNQQGIPPMPRPAV